ncbi:MAG: serine hydrolase domain-containing protein [Gemmatimonadota bacterium]|jgi:CubicO group peptidase (beta-lactamase class C family)
MIRAIRLALLSVCFAATGAAQELDRTEGARIDSTALAVLEATGAPSASIAVVRGGEIVYERALGLGRIDPATDARPTMRYSIGSVSKQFTATAVLLLEEEGRLSLDDPVAEWFPGLTRADEISLRQLLSMTSGYQDYWPHDFVFADMKRPVTAREIMERWAKKPLDFDPGTRWQYSNTNYVIAAAIVERVAGMPFMDFLGERIFTPLGMTSVANVDAGPLGPEDAQPTLRHALGPLRPAPKEATGWLFGAGQLAMTSHDLGLWNRGVIEQAILTPESYRTQQTEVLLESGTATGYGLGVGIGTPGGHRRVSHGGAVSGYTTTNYVYPDDGVAITVFTNIYPGTAGASSRIAVGIRDILFAPDASEDAAAHERARRVYDGLTRGTIDRSLLSPIGDAYFTDEVLSDYATSLGPLGPPTEFSPTGKTLRGGMTIRYYRIRAGGVVMQLTTMTLPDGRMDQYLVSRAS